MYFDEALSKRVREISEKRKITYSRWAIKAGLAPGTLYDWVNGRFHYPKLHTLKKLCDAIKMPLTEFFDCDYLLNSEIREEDWGGE